MTKRKLQRYEEIKSFNNFFQPYYREIIKGFYLKTRWMEDFFKNRNRLILELGCGKGEFTVGLAQKYPDRNYIGLDIKGSRIWRGCKTSAEKSMKNVAFIRTRIELIEHFFGADEVDEIWITFPDPQLNKPKIKKRLTSPQFLDRYRKISRNGCIVHLKTDNTNLFEYTLSVIREQKLELFCHTYDVYKNWGNEDVASIQTFYEKMALDLGNKIKYLSFSLF